MFRIILAVTIGVAACIGALPVHADIGDADYHDLISGMRWCIDDRNHAQGRNELIAALDHPTIKEYDIDGEHLSRGDYIRKYYLSCQSHQAPREIKIDNLHIANFRDAGRPWTEGENASAAQLESAIDAAQHGCPPCLGR